jgi:hypothetical protein
MWKGYASYNATAASKFCNKAGKKMIGPYEPDWDECDDPEGQPE